MKFATLAACPVFGGKVGKVDDSAREENPGRAARSWCSTIMVAVVGDHMWAAKKGLDALKIDWDEGPNAKISSKDIWQDLRAASEKDGAVAKSVGDIAKGLSTGDKVRGGIRAAVPRACDDGAAERHGSCQAGRLRDLDRHADREPGAVGSGQSGGTAGREGDRQQPPARRRLRPQARAGHGGRGGARGQAGRTVRSRWCGRARKTSSTTSTARSIATTSPRRWSDGKVAAWKHQGHGLVDPGALAAAGVPEGHRHRRRRQPRSTCPTTFRTSMSNMCAPSRRRCRPASGAASARTTTCSRSNASMDELARKAGKDPIEFRRAMLGKHAAAAGGAQSRGGKIQLGRATAGARRPRRLRCSRRSRQLHRNRGGSRGRRTRARWRCAASPRWSIPASPSIPTPSKAQLEGGLIFGLTAALYGEITIDKGRVQQSNFHDYRMLRIDQTPKIEVHVVKSGEPPGGIGETGVNGRPAGAAQRDLCRNRRRAAAPADRPFADRCGEEGMRRGRAHSRAAVAVIVIAAIAIGTWIIRGPGPLDFRGGPKVALADYRGDQSDRRTGGARESEPRSKRGEYLARAADCMVCHTSQGGKQYAGGLGFKLPFGTLYSTNITRRQGNRHRQLQRSGFSERGPARQAPRRRAALSGDAVSRPTPI